MKLVDRDLEKQAIKFVCKGSRYSNLLLAKLNKEHFGNAYTKHAFNRIAHFAQQRSEILSWNELLSDPAVPEEARKALKAYKTPVNTDSKQVQSLHRSLEKYRKARMLYNMYKEGAEALSQDSVDEDVLIEKTADTIAKIRSGKSNIISVNVGVKGNSGEKLALEVLSNKGTPVIPTGIKAFDSRNRGFFIGSLVTLGGYTGAGKTAIADQLADNMSQQGFSVCQVSLEMTEKELMARKLARISKTSLSKIIAPMESLTKSERENIYQAYVKHSARIKKKGGQQNIRVPEDDVSIEELFFTLKPYGYDVIIVDYLTLLKGADGDDQWRKLGQITRFCKVFAKNNNCVVIMLCQINQDATIRYSKAIAEHSNNAWLFTRDEAYEENNILHVKQGKARMGAQFDFDLFADLDIMTITDVTEEQEKAMAEETTRRKRVDSGASGGKDGKKEKFEKQNGKSKLPRSAKEEKWLKEI